MRLPEKIKRESQKITGETHRFAPTVYPPGVWKGELIQLRISNYKLRIVLLLNREFNYKLRTFARFAFNADCAGMHV